MCKDQFVRDKDGNPLRGQNKYIKVDDPYLHVKYAYNETSRWRHLQCWDVRVSPISRFFESSIGNISLSSIQHAIDLNPSLLEGWQDDLNCIDWLKVMQHVFIANLLSCHITSDHVVM